MAQNYNSELTSELRDVGKIQTIRDRIPNEFADKIVPVIDVNPKKVRRINKVLTGSKSTSGTLTIGTTPADMDFYLSVVNLSVIKDAACDMATGPLAITVTQDGATINLVRIETITLTAQQINLSVTLPCPMKLDRGTTVTMNGTFAAGVMQRGATVLGYLTDDKRA